MGQRRWGSLPNPVQIWTECFTGEQSGSLREDITVSDQSAILYFKDYGNMVPLS